MAMQARCNSKSRDSTISINLDDNYTRVKVITTFLFCMNVNDLVGQAMKSLNTFYTISNYLISNSYFRDSISQLHINHLQQETRHGA